MNSCVGWCFHILKKKWISAIQAAAPTATEIVCKAVTVVIMCGYLLLHACPFGLYIAETNLKQLKHTCSQPSLMIFSCKLWTTPIQNCRNRPLKILMSRLALRNKLTKICMAYHGIKLIRTVCYFDKRVW